MDIGFAVELNKNEEKFDVFVNSLMWYLSGIFSAKVLKDICKGINYVLFLSSGERCLVFRYKSKSCKYVPLLIRAIRDSQLSTIYAKVGVFFKSRGQYKESPETELEILLVHDFTRSFEFVFSEDEIKDYIDESFKKIQCTPLALASFLLPPTRYGMSLKISLFQTLTALLMLSQEPYDALVGDQIFCMMALSYDAHFLRFMDKSIGSMESQHIGAYNGLQFLNVT